MLRLLIADAYPAQSTVNMINAGGRPSASVIFPSAFTAEHQQVETTVLAVAEGKRLGHNVALTDFDGIAITGSPLGAYEQRPEVARQIEFARAAFESGVPVWGSCFGMQVMSAALGGEVRRNPKGNEVGIARRIRPTAEGQGHPLFEGKPDAAFDAITHHQDEVCRLPEGATLLATNDMTDVQAIEIERNGCHFWGVQYHPEYDLAHIALLLSRKSADRLVADGFARTTEELRAYADDLAALGADPNRRDIAWRYGLGREIFDQSLHSRELRNWLTHVVAARQAERLASSAPGRRAAAR